MSQTVKRGKFSNVEKTFIQAKHKDMKVEDIAAELGRSVGATNKQYLEMLKGGELSPKVENPPTKAVAEAQPLVNNLSHRVDGKGVYDPQSGFVQRDGITVGTQNSSQQGDEHAKRNGSKKIIDRNKKHITKARQDRA